MPDLVTVLDRLPEGVRRLVHRTAAGRGVLGRLADAVRFRFSESEVPRLPEPSGARIRMLIGPANSAGQGFQWARAIERHIPSASVTAMHGLGIDPFLPPADLRVPVAVYRRASSWHLAFEEYLAGRTHIIWESGLPLLGRRHGSDPLAEMRWAVGHGVRPALMFHGSDIRPPTRHAARNRWSPFHEASGPVNALEATALRNAEISATAGVPVFVSTPDLLQWVPGATWVPVVVDVGAWASRDRALASGRRPVVVHAPTQRWIKGTDLIEPMLLRLAAEGVIEYRQLVGVPHAAMPEFYGSADIVLDQFRLGSYGVAACEALAAGRLVMGHVDQATRDLVRSETGHDLPIHEATIDSLEAALRRAAADPLEFGEFGVAGPAFVEAVHAGRRSAAAFEPYLQVNA